MTPELLNMAVRAFVRVGFPAAIAAVLIWFTLTRIDRAIEHALTVQGQIAATVERCCR